MATATRAALFDPGDIVITRGALAKIDQDDILKAFVRHLGGDWGEVEKEDRLNNNLAVQQGGRLASAHTSAKGVRFWIITEADRSVTTFLLPEEY